MAESQQKLLARELAEINAGERELWSARALQRAERVTRNMADRWQRCRALALEVTGIAPARLADVSVPIRQLESRAWLLNFMWAQLAEEHADGQDREDQHDADCAAGY